MCAACALQARRSLRLTHNRAAERMSVDLSQTKELEGLENASGQVDVQLEADGCQVELSGLFRITSHSELVACVTWVLWAHAVVQRWAMLDVYLPYAVCCVSEV